MAIRRATSATVTFAGGTSPREPSLALPPRFRVERLLGRGGQGSVWLATDEQLGDRVAVKIFANLSATARERLRREVKLSRRLQHAGLVRMFELLEAGDAVAVAMEWVRGGSLEGAGPLPAERLVEVARGVLEVLAYLHGQGVVHRDVKPSNVLLDETGRVRLADLGLARAVTEDSDLTGTAAAIGTPGFMSPEQLRGEMAGPASDLYGLGATLYELATGRRAFPESSLVHRLRLQLGAPPDPRREAPGCPAWLGLFIMRLLEPRPRDRFRDAVAALQALERRQQRISPRRMRRVLAVSAAVPLAVAAGTLGWSLRAAKTVRVIEAAPGRAVATDAAGRELWRREFPGLTVHPVVADVIGDRSPEVVLALDLPKGTIGGWGEEDMILLSPAGHELTRLASTHPWMEQFPFTIKAPLKKMFTGDADGDGRLDLAWSAKDHAWYPSQVWCWLERQGRGPLELLRNSGYVVQMAFADTDGDGEQEMVVSGLNNPLGFQAMVVVLDASAAARSTTRITAYSPDRESAWARGDVPTVETYVVLGNLSVTKRLEASEGRITLSGPGGTVELDGAGNPVGSAMAGRPPTERMAFWIGLARAATDLANGVPDADGRIAAFEAAHARALAERPNRLAAALMLARGYARGRRHAEAAALLRRGLAAMPEAADLRLRLGEQLIISGQRNEGLTVLLQCMTPRSGERTPFDAGVEGALVSSLDGDPEATSRFVAALTRAYHMEPFRQELAALWAFHRGTWRDVALDAAPEGLLVPWVDVLRRWGRWEREGAVPFDVAPPPADTSFIESLLQDLFRARVLVAAGDGRKAAVVARDTLEQLRLWAPDHLESFVWVPLAERVLGDALRAAGDASGAEVHLRRAAELAPNCWFGRP